MMNITIGTIIKLSTGRRPFQESVFLSDDLCPRTKTSWFSGKSHLFLIEKSPHAKLDKKIDDYFVFNFNYLFQECGDNTDNGCGVKECVVSGNSFFLSPLLHIFGKSFVPRS